MNDCRKVFRDDCTLMLDDHFFRYAAIERMRHFKILSYDSLQYSQPTYLRELFTIEQNPLYPIILLSHLFTTPGHFASLHHVFGMDAYHLRYGASLKRRIISLEWPAPEVRKFSLSTLPITSHHFHPAPPSITSRALHSKLKCHLFKNSYPDSSVIPPYLSTSDHLEIGLSTLDYSLDNTSDSSQRS